MGWPSSNNAKTFAGHLAIFVAIAMQCVAGPAAAQGDLILSGLTFPPHIAGTDRGRHTNLETRQQGLGHGVAYATPDWTINVFVYDLGKPAIPDDIESGELAAQFEDAMADIKAAGAQGAYPKLMSLRRFMVEGLDRTPHFRCASYTMRLPARGDVDSFLCLTAWQGKFVKFRATTEQHEDSESLLRQYLGAWIEHLWPQG